MVSEIGSWMVVAVKPGSPIEVPELKFCSPIVGETNIDVPVVAIVHVSPECHFGVIDPGP
jgi:hypothetical protein